jgi:hypothetical protein
MLNAKFSKIVLSFCFNGLNPDRQGGAAYSNVQSAFGVIKWESHLNQAGRKPV